MTQIPAGTYTIDPAHSRVGFVTRHAMVTKVRGQFTEVDGTITVGDSFADSTTEATVQMASVTTHQEQRDEHLRTGDFFDVEQHPTMTFRSTSVEGQGEAFTLAGDLTIKGITRPVTFDVDFGGVAKDPYGNTRIGFDATTTINRSDFGITFNAALETGGVLVSEKVQIELEISAVQNA